MRKHPPPPVPNKILMTTKEAAEYLGGLFSVSSLNHFRCNRAPDGPPFVKIGTRVRYRRQDLDKYIESKVVDPKLFRRKHG